MKWPREKKVKWSCKNKKSRNRKLEKNRKLICSDTEKDLCSKFPEIFFKTFFFRLTASLYTVQRLFHIQRMKQFISDASVSAFFVCLFVCLYMIFLFVCLSVYIIFVCLFVCIWFFCMFVCLYLILFVCLFVCIWFFWFVCLFDCIWFFCLSIQKHKNTLFLWNEFWEWNF